MGKSTGFMEYDRIQQADRPPQERLQDWQEIHCPMPEESLQLQASRCMECGTPFCHTGMMINGMVSGCPLHNLMPEWNDLVYHGLWQEALSRLLKTNNFPEFTGRVCPAPCEGACTAGLAVDPVTIRDIEVAIVDKGFEQGWVLPQSPVTRTGKRVAVVGSGPAGLACADQLNRAGHSVTVFERADRIGGLLMYGIPNMKLDKKIVERRVKVMAEAGVEFLTETEVGSNYPAEKLLTEFDAAVLCGGATAPRNLVVPGRELEGIYFAVDFLKQNTKSLLDSNLKDGHYISAAGKDVLVIGGGDTGTDCVGTVLRHGCRSVEQLEIMPQLPLERSEGNPWPQFPKVHKVDYGQQEAAERFGDDPRNYSVTTKRFVGDEQGRVKEVHTVQLAWAKNDHGQLCPTEIPGSEKVWKADIVLLAMGFLGPEANLLEQLKIERDTRSNVKADDRKFATSVPGLFAAGDMRRGQSLVAWAIHEGRSAARECDQFLMGHTQLA